MKSLRITSPNSSNNKFFWILHANIIIFREDMQDILERKKSGQLKFHTHQKVW